MSLKRLTTGSESIKGYTAGILKHIKEDVNISSLGLMIIAGRVKYEYWTEYNLGLMLHSIVLVITSCKLGSFK